MNRATEGATTLFTFNRKKDIVTFIEEKTFITINNLNV